MKGWSPPIDYPFEGPAKPAGAGVRLISLSGLSIRLEGLGEPDQRFVDQRFRRYVVAANGARADLTLGFRRDPAAPYLEPRLTDATLTGYQLHHAVLGDVLYYSSVTVCARLDLEAATGIVLRRELTGTAMREDPVHMAVENLLRACLAWTVLRRGGFMLHAASVVRDGGCILFFGTSNAGKSTIASLGGGQVISDDLTLLLPEGDGFVAIGTPFRGTYAACEDLTGRYPVVGVYRLVKDDRAFVEKRAAAVAFSDFVANLTFVVGELGHQPRAWEAIEAAFAKLNVRYLHFRKDSSFWEAIAAEGMR